MVKLFPILGALTSLSGLILLSISAATNRWLHLHHVDAQLNPVLTNSKLTPETKAIGTTSSTTQIEYSTAYYGLWIGCHRERKGAVTCAYIGTNCRSHICWIRKTSRSRSKTCQDDRVHAIKTCAAFQTVRAFVVLALAVMVFGCAMQLVSLITANRALAMIAGVVMFVAGVLAMIAFAVFYGEIVVRSGIRAVGGVGFGVKVLAGGWVLMVGGGVLSCFAASLGLRHKEVSDYSASNY